MKFAFGPPAATKDEPKIGSLAFYCMPSARATAANMHNGRITLRGRRTPSAQP